MNHPPHPVPSSGRLRRGARFARLRFDIFLGFSFDSTMGFPGEGPPRKTHRRQRHMGVKPRAPPAPPLPSPVHPLLEQPHAIRPRGHFRPPAAGHLLAPQRPPGRPRGSFDDSRIAPSHCTWLLGVLLPAASDICDTPLDPDRCRGRSSANSTPCSTRADYRRKVHEVKSAEPDPRGLSPWPRTVIRQWNMRLNANAYDWSCREMYRTISDRPPPDQALAD